MFRSCQRAARGPAFAAALGWAFSGAASCAGGCSGAAGAGFSCGAAVGGVCSGAAGGAAWSGAAGAGLSCGALGGGACSGTGAGLSCGALGGGACSGAGAGSCCASYVRAGSKKTSITARQQAWYTFRGRFIESPGWNKGGTPITVSSHRFRQRFVAPKSEQYLFPMNMLPPECRNFSPPLGISRPTHGPDLAHYVHFRLWDRLTT